MRVPFLLPILTVLVIGLGQPAFAVRPEPDLIQGQEAYEANCVRCHGITGAGDGPDAKKMFPRPRNLAEGIFKFRTTESGAPPTDDDLFRTISTGLPGSRMPDFQRLPEETRWNVIAYVKRFSSNFQGQKPNPVDLGKDPGPRKAHVAKGKELYVQLGCAACHGDLGRGNGPSAATLVDNWGNPIRPADLTEESRYRGGGEPRDVVARVLTGIDGTPMPSYADAISSREDVWDLAYYVKSLQVPPRFGRKIRAFQVAGELPTDANDSVWQKAPRTDLRLSSLFYQNGEILPTAVGAVAVQAVYNEEAILFRFAWDDASESRQNPADSLNLVRILERRQKTEVGSIRNLRFDKELAHVEVTSWHADQETAGAASSYADGQWVLLMKKSLPESQPALVGVAIWDGGNAEEGRRRGNSNWVDLVLE